MLGDFLKFKVALDLDSVFSHFLLYKSYNPHKKTKKHEILFENNHSKVFQVFVNLVNVAKVLNLIVLYLSCWGKTTWRN